ncbi:hypothetical protein QZM35_32965 [Burkholderia sp. AU45274]|uniref:hypothetical protein n=1 Tax=Burkholderia sp. AU45274 TaxID=3059205 RepID=UPI00264EBF18|nr:hypothetical protein [Burkholderia sp. AU45274]MDN7492544.1 hypothetical protein [Burkholderia sp. AU45274]
MADANNEYQIDHSKVTPGEVVDKEDILLAVIEPNNWADGAFSKQGFQKKHLTARSLSVARQPYSSPRRLKFFVFDIILQRPGKIARGVTRFNARALRELSSKDGTRQFIILDAPLPRNNKIDFAHAHIGFSENTITKGSNEQTAAVLNLRELLEKSGEPKKPEAQFAPFPLLYFRLSEFRLLRLRLRIWRNGSGKQFLALAEKSAQIDA